MNKLKAFSFLLFALTVTRPCKGSVLARDKELETILSNSILDLSPLVDNEDGQLTVPQLIEKYGYPVEVHHITTSDGYILEAHRIPYGIRCGPAINKRVAWLQHGLISDSSNWVLNGVEKALAYNMADGCYDVWMGNARGNTYSKGHVTLDPAIDKEEYWSFSFHEMGTIDLPESIDYVLNITGAEGLYYTGHSMGTTQFFVMGSERPEYMEKIKLASLMAPVSYAEHMKSPIALMAPFSNSVEWLLGMFGLYEFLPSNAFMDFLGKTVCHQNSTLQALCSNVLFLICGFDTAQLDPNMVPVIVGHTPAGGSARSVVHLSQGVPTGHFRQYDYGTVRKNLEHYGQELPFDYDLSKVTARVALYWGANDLLSNYADLFRLAEELPNLVRIYRVDHDRFNHLDFLWAVDAVELINRPVLSFMHQFY